MHAAAISCSCWAGREAQSQGIHPLGNREVLSMGASQEEEHAHLLGPPQERVLLKKVQSTSQNQNQPSSNVNLGPKIPESALVLGFTVQKPNFYSGPDRPMGPW